MSAPSHASFRWLRKLSVDLWVWAQYVRALFVYGPKIGMAETLEERSQLFAVHIRTLLEVAGILIQSTTKKPLTHWKWRAFFRAWYYSHVATTVAAVPRDMQSGLSEDDLQRVIHLGELAVEHYESGGKQVIERTARKRKGFGAIAARQRKCLQQAFFHTSLASLYLRVNAGDLSRNLENAFTRYRAAAAILEQENLPVLSLYAAVVWAMLGTAYLQYPTERRADYAGQALEVFGKAKEVVALHGASLKSPMPELWNDQFLRGLSFVSRAKYGARLGMHAARGRWKMRWQGVPDAFRVGTLLPLFELWVNWQLGVAYRQLGQLEKAIEHFDLALQGPTKDSEDFKGLRAEVEVDRGYAHLEAQSGERRKNLDLAIGSFKNALAGCVENGNVRSDATKAYALALVGDARLYFELSDRGEIKPEQRKQSLPILINQLRSAAKVARIAATPQAVQDALFLLGKAYELQGDSVRAYRALAAASRVADRLWRRARTPRLLRHLVGTEEPLDAFLVRTALNARAQSEKTALKGNGKVKVVPLRSALRFAERGRTVFLATQLRSLKLLPKGASEGEVGELFERRRLWHEVELKLLEQESAPSADEKVLMTLRERRNVVESRYFAELETVRERFGEPHYDPDQPVLPVRTDEIWAILGEFSKQSDTALVEYYFSDQDLVAFVLLPASLHQVYVRISRNELAAIEDHWERGSEALMSPKHWENGYLLQVLNRLQAAAEMPAKSIADYEAKTGKQIKRVIVVPHRFLHLIPLHAIELSGGRRWGEAASIQYAPSISVLLPLLRSRSARKAKLGDRPASHREVLSVCYSSPAGKPPLLFNFEEARAVAEATGGRLLSGQEATPARVKEHMRRATYVHFACHGRFDRNAALDSALQLAADARGSGSQPGAARDEEQTDARSLNGRLTLGEIFRSVHLPHADLVVLSACETGVTKVKHGHEEYIGLPAGFLYAGASTVVSTLWPVADIGTWLLMRAFARETAAGSSPAAALRCAQQQLRGLSREWILGEIAQAAERENNPWRREQMIEAGQSLPQDAFPFAGPYWWAGFTVNGLG